MRLDRIEGSLQKVARQARAIDDPPKVLTCKILLGSGGRNHLFTPGRQGRNKPRSDKSPGADDREVCHLARDPTR